MENKGLVLSGIMLALLCWPATGAFSADASCDIQECQGLEVTCGDKAPQACTAMYRLGDFCRQFVSCQIVDGKCRKVETPEFRGCRSCVEDCAQVKDPVAAFECESRCRREYEKNSGAKRIIHHAVAAGRG